MGGIEENYRCRLPLRGVIDYASRKNKLNFTECSRKLLTFILNAFLTLIKVSDQNSNNIIVN